jgi:hypothetical protein
MKQWNQGAWMRLAIELLILSMVANAAAMLAVLNGHRWLDADASVGIAGLSSFLLLLGSFACVVVGKRAWSIAKRRTLLMRCCVGFAAWFLVFFVCSTLAFEGVPAG